jgi:TRAP-type mannitol/chloroaromatic compound transport system permease small subunit
MPLGEDALNLALKISSWIDSLNKGFGVIATWMVLLACLVSAGNASFRYVFSNSSNAWLEIQWYMFSAIFLLGAAYTLKVNEHVRVDIIYANLPPRGRLWVDSIGVVLFLLPATVMLSIMTWPFFWEAWARNEISSNAGGLPRWPVKLLLPVGFAMLSLQGISELIKRIAALRGTIEVETNYEKPLQ